MEQKFLITDSQYDVEYLLGEGWMKMLYKSDLIIKLNRDGGYEVMKDRFGLSKEQIENEIHESDERLLLMLG